MNTKTWIIYTCPYWREYVETRGRRARLVGSSGQQTTRVTIHGRVGNGGVRVRFPDGHIEMRHPDDLRPA